MKRFPLFIKLAGRRAVVLGGGEVGLRRARVLRDFGASVTVISPMLSGPAEGMVYLPRRYQEGDLEGAFLAVAAADHAEVNAAAGREARRLGILFNRSDCPADCDFFFPAICEGTGLTAGVVGDGADHHRTAEAARRVREALQELDDVKNAAPSGGGAGECAPIQNAAPRSAEGDGACV